jgi:hypothetical protein
MPISRGGDVFYSNEGDYPGADKRTVPLMVFWILAPVAVLILVVAVTRLFVPAIDLHLGGRLIGVAIRGGGDPVLMSSATEFDWDRVCIFRPFTPAATVNTQLGEGWNGLLDHDRPTLVFVNRARVVLHAAISPRAIEPPPPRGVCHGAADAVVRWSSSP